VCLARRVCAIFTAQEGNATLAHLTPNAHPCGKPRAAATRFTWHSPCRPLALLMPHAGCSLSVIRLQGGLSSLEQRRGLCKFQDPHGMQVRS
jgi:hypothetical protein